MADKSLCFSKGGITTESNTNILLSRYIVKKILKSGRDTDVYLVEHPTTNQKLIIKKLLISEFSTERFNRETNILKTLKHSHIPLLYDVHKDEDYYYIIEEYIEGESLKSIVQSRNLSIDTAIRYIIQLCDIFKYLHEHPEGTILYLDCRPDNIIISKEKVYLIDFGSSIIYKNRAPKQHFLYGSIGYAAPELYTPSLPLSERTDVYGLGALLYYMLSGGHSPTEDNDFHKRKFPKKILHIIKKCLRHQPGLRYSDIAALSSAFNQIIFPEKISTNIKNTSLTISIAGSDRRVGTTHLGISLASYFLQQNQNCIFKELSTHGIFPKLLECTEEAVFITHQENTFTYKGIPIVPKYDSDSFCCPINTGIIINDFGTLTKENAQNFNNADICLLIGSGKPWEFQDLLEKTKLCVLSKTILIINFINGTDFYKICSKNNDCFFIRMPYYTDLHAQKGVGKHFLIEICDEIDKKKSNSCRTAAI